MAEPFGTLSPGPDITLRDRLTDLLAAIYGGGKGGQQMGRQAVGVFDWLPGTGEALSASEGTQAWKEGDYLGAGLGAVGAIPGGGKVAKVGKELAAPLVKGVKELAAPLTKKAAEAAEREANRAALNRTIRDRKLKPGMNIQPFINPDAKELAAIRKEHGGHGLDAGDLKKTMKETYVDPSQTADLFPAPSPRTREQRKLERKEIPAGGTTPRMQAMMANPAVKAAIQAAAEKGKHVQSWYDTTPLQQMFLKEFGPDEGQARFEDYIGMVAGTSTSNPIGQNIRTASNYYAQKYGGGRDVAANPYIRKDDIRMHELPDDTYEVPPALYGSHVQQTHMHNMNALARSGDLSSLDNPKISAFRENLLGNWEPTTVDKHAVRLGAMATQDPRWLTPQGQEALAGGASMEELLQRPTNWLDVPGKPGAEYTAMEGMWDDIAREMGVTPAELQAMAWVGGGEQTDLKSAPVTFMDAFQDRIRRTAIRDNIPPDQVMKLMLHGKLTLAQLEPPAGDVPGSSMFA